MIMTRIILNICKKKSKNVKNPHFVKIFGLFGLFGPRFRGKKVWGPKRPKRPIGPPTTLTLLTNSERNLNSALN